MRRDFIVIVGNQGQGKSVWSKSYSERLTRLLVSDPMGSYNNVNFLRDPEEWIPGVINKETKEFRYGTYSQDDLPLFGSAAYAAEDCTFVIEECALIFERGEKLPLWLNRAIFMGRHSRLNLVLIAQRASKIPIDIRSQANRFITFLQTEPNDVRATADRIGIEEDSIRSLPPLHCIDWNEGRVSSYSVTP